MAKGLSDLISMAVEMHLLLGVIAGSSDLMVSHLQYADDMIILANTTIDNLWTIKASLCGFKLALGPRVNFSKSSLIRVNPNHAFLELACEFLHYKKESVPFKYLVLQIRTNPRLTSTS